MNIAEAAKSGRKFSRPGFNHFFGLHGGIFELSQVDLLADDWFLEPEKIETDVSKYYEAVSKIMKEIYSNDRMDNSQYAAFAQKLLVELKK